MMAEAVAEKSETAEKMKFGQVCVVIMGPPLAGKSTLARALAEKSNIEVVDIDLVRRELEKENASSTHPLKNEQEIMKSAYKATLARAREKLQRGSPVVIAATFSGPHNFLEDFAKSGDFPIAPFVLEYPPERQERLLADRLIKRNEEPFSNSNILTIGHALEVIRRFKVFEGFEYRPTEHLDAGKNDENLGLIIKSLDAYRVPV